MSKLSLNEVKALAGLISVGELDESSLDKFDDAQLEHLAEQFALEELPGSLFLQRILSRRRGEVFLEEIRSQRDSGNFSLHKSMRALCFFLEGQQKLELYDSFIAEQYLQKSAGNFSLLSQASELIIRSSRSEQKQAEFWLPYSVAQSETGTPLACALWLKILSERMGQSLLLHWHASAELFAEYRQREFFISFNSSSPEALSQEELSQRFASKGWRFSRRRLRPETNERLFQRYLRALTLVYKDHTLHQQQFLVLADFALERATDETTADEF